MKWEIFLHWSWTEAEFFATTLYLSLVQKGKKSIASAIFFKKQTKNGNYPKFTSTDTCKEENVISYQRSTS